VAQKQIGGVAKQSAEKTALPELLDKTDIGNAKRFVEKYSETVRYVDGLGFVVFDGKRSKIDSSNVNAIGLAEKLVIDMAKESPTSSWVKKSAKKASLDAMVAIAKSDKSLRANMSDFDSDPLIITVQNGRLHIPTRELLPFDPMTTHISNFTYDPDAKCPLWDAFLDRIMAGNKNLIGYLQRAAGLTLTGRTNDKALFFLYGNNGNNGKSVLTRTLSYGMGEYATGIQTETLMTRAKDAAAMSDIAQLAGKRMAIASELNGDSLNARITKDLTGGSDQLRGKFFHQNPFSFDPTHKLWMFGNEKPVIKETTDSIWERIKLIPFTVSIPAAERDRQLPQKLEAELPGILNWALDGAEAYLAGGLQDPDEVKACVGTYRSENDVLGQFIAEYCLKGDGYKVSTSDFCAKFYSETGKSVSNIEMGNMLKARGYQGGVTVKGKNGWKGIALKESM